MSKIFRIVVALLPGAAIMLMVAAGIYSRQPENIEIAKHLMLLSVGVMFLAFLGVRNFFYKDRISSLDVDEESYL